MVHSTRPTVLFAIADQKARDRVCETLERAGCRALRASDGAEALDVLHREGGQVDVALLDLVMPRLGGVAALRRIRAYAPRVGVVLMCRHTDGVGGRILGKQADAHLCRPFDRGTLFMAIEQGLDLGRTRDETPRPEVQESTRP
jgi:CheY-like chemotaxis protein